ncbi:MAG TPA: TIGR02281 family clan AA aspartic protease [Allosphingosinicella sp.]|nr:TIGR02281 family clan AA aspartic protease [Allosphingosinicella sp.]
MSGPLTFAGFVVVTVLLFVPEGEPAGPAASVAMETAGTAAPPTLFGPQRSTNIGNGYASSELVRSPDGHFYAEAQVNGARVRFLVDTGASFVALTPADAQRAGIAPRSERAKAFGAGGEIEVMPVTIDRVAIGPLTASNVAGAVIDELPVSLLGQSYLSRVGSVKIEGDRMVLR